MAIIGRLRCYLCDFEGAHVKVNAPKLPYQHCPDCGAMLTAKSKHQARLMLAKMRPIDQVEADSTPPAVDIEHKAPAVATPPVPPAAVRQAKPSFWAQMAGKP